MTLPLAAAIVQCQLHARRLEQAIADAGLPLADVPAAGEDEALVRTLDQLVLRYIKLQDTMGEQVLRSFAVQVLGEPVEDLPFIDVLHRLEKRGYLDAGDWLAQRRLRNALTHEYPDQPARQRAILNEAAPRGRQLIAWLDRIESETPKASLP